MKENADPVQRAIEKRRKERLKTHELQAEANNTDWRSPLNEEKHELYEERFNDQMELHTARAEDLVTCNLGEGQPLNNDLHRDLDELLDTHPEELERLQKKLHYIDIVLL